MRFRKWLPESHRQLSLTVKLSVSRQKDPCLFKLTKLLIWSSVLSSRSIFLWTYAIRFPTWYMEAELQKIEDVHLQFYWTSLYYIPNSFTQFISHCVCVCVCVYSYVLSSFSHVWLFPMLWTVLAGYNWSFVCTYLLALI